MGAWSTSITGNDTAQDLLPEYTAAFFRYDAEEAAARIDAYVRREMFDESDPEAWCDYVYSLADFMWKKGVLTEETRQRAVSMIDSGFGLELWEEAGRKTLEARKKKLAEFREKLLSPMPPRRKIRPRAYLERIFEEGDVIAVQLQTAGKPYTEGKQKPMTEEAFHAMDGKYVLMQLIKCRASWSSRIVPEVKDYWASFRLFDGVYDQIPTDIDVALLPLAQMKLGEGVSSVFTCESSLVPFKRRKYKLLGNRRELLEGVDSATNNSVYWSINAPHLNPDSQLLAAMGKERRCGAFAGSPEQLTRILHLANCYGRYSYRLTPAENEEIFAKEEARIDADIHAALAAGEELLALTFGREIGVVTASRIRVANLYIEGEYQRCGFGTTLLEYAFSRAQKGAYIDVPEDHAILLHICRKIGLEESTDGNDGFVRMVKA